MLMSVDVDIAPPAVHDDVYVQTTPNELDLLWVVDNTSSMDADRANLIASAPGFVQALDAAGVDYHIGVTTTGIAAASAANGPRLVREAQRPGEAGRLFPVDGSAPRVIDPTMADRGELLAQNMTVGGCNSVQEDWRQRSWRSPRRSWTTPTIRRPRSRTTATSASCARTRRWQ